MHPVIIYCGVSVTQNALTASHATSSVLEAHFTVDIFMTYQQVDDIKKQSFHISPVSPSPRPQIFSSWLIDLNDAFTYFLFCYNNHSTAHELFIFFRNDQAAASIQSKVVTTGKCSLSFFNRNAACCLHYFLESTPRHRPSRHQFPL